MNRKLFFIFILALMFCPVGCEKKSTFENEKASEKIAIELPEVNADFKLFIEQRREELKSTLENNGIIPTAQTSNSKDNKNDWLEYRVKSIKNIETDEISTVAWVWIWGTSKFFGEIDLPEAIMIMFEYKDDKWLLVLADGYLADPATEEDKTNGLSPEVHVAIKSIFPNHLQII